MYVCIGKSISSSVLSAASGIYWWPWDIYFADKIGLLYFIVSSISRKEDIIFDIRTSLGE